nr:PREDICTED: cyclin-J-like isoform X2 [Bemisia tabaci]
MLVNSTPLLVAPVAPDLTNRKTQCTEIYSVSMDISEEHEKFDSWVRDYIFEYYAVLKQKEERRPIIRCRSSQLNIRGGLVDFIKAVSDELHFTHITRHRAVYMIDQFMDAGNFIRKPYLRLVAVVCLILAAKYEESEMSIPKLSTLQKYIDVEFTRKDFITLEKTLFSHFKWQLSIPTGVDFAEHQCLFAISLHESQTLGYSLKNLRAIVRGLTYDYLDVTLSEIGFLHYSPSKVGAICLRAARVTLKLLPSWPDLLRISTGYCEEELFVGYRLLMNIPLPDRKRKSDFGSPESGYGSGGDGDNDMVTSPNKRFR